MLKVESNEYSKRATVNAEPFGLIVPFSVAEVAEMLVGAESVRIGLVVKTAIRFAGLPLIVVIKPPT